MTHSGGQPHAVGDRGQRYEVTYIDLNTRTRKTFGWSDDMAGVNAMVESIRRHPSMSNPEYRDRSIKE